MKPVNVIHEGGAPPQSTRMAHFDAPDTKGAKARASYESCRTFIHSAKHVEFAYPDIRTAIGRCAGNGFSDLHIFCVNCDELAAFFGLLLYIRRAAVGGRKSACI